jgi:hypothetical protein
VREIQVEKIEGELFTFRILGYVSIGAALNLDYR